MTVAAVATRDLALGLGQWAVSDDPGEALVCLGLGSCVAFVAYDPVARLGGMAHMVLPDSTLGRASDAAPAKFVDLAIPLVLDAMQARGAGRARLVIDLVGGARVLRGVGASEAMQIGDRNTAACRAALAALRLPAHAQDLGGTQGRTVRLAVDSGEVTVSTAGTRRTLA